MLLFLPENIIYIYLHTFLVLHAQFINNVEVCESYKMRMSRAVIRAELLKSLSGSLLFMFIELSSGFVYVMKHF